MTFDDYIAKQIPVQKQIKKEVIIEKDLHKDLAII